MANVLNTDKQIAIIAALKQQNQKKPSRAGRPPLPKGNAKAVMLRVRVTADERLAIETAAKASSQTASEWIRGKLLATIGA
jgi:hypothetical protein